MQIIEFKGEKYPGFQAFGNAAQFAIPYAKHFCRGRGYDIGCSKVEWSFPGSIVIDLDKGEPYLMVKNGLLEAGHNIQTILDNENWLRLCVTCCAK